MKQVWLAAALLVAALGCQSGPSTGGREIQVAVTEKGFEPSEIHVKKGEAVVLAITRRTDKTCATEVMIDDGEARTALPLDQTVRIDLGEVRADTKFACGMDMIRGTVVPD
jgi:plastocyanin domain-containing protein